MSDNIRTDAIELLVTKEDFIELMDDNAKLLDEIERLTAENTMAMSLELPKRYKALEAENKQLRDLNEQHLGRIAVLEEQGREDNADLLACEAENRQLREALIEIRGIAKGAYPDLYRAVVEALK